MGNEQSSTTTGNDSDKITISKEEMERHRADSNKMRKSIADKNDQIHALEDAKRKQDYEIADLEKKVRDLMRDKQTVCENLGSIKSERNELYKKIEGLHKKLEEKEEEMKQRDAEAMKTKKSVTSELNKYKSMPELEAIMKLNGDLVDFQGKIESVVSNNCDLLQMNDEDREIEKIKRKNAELYGQLKSTGSNVKAIVMEKSGELKDAENELNMKKEFARQEFLKVNGKLMIIKEKMSQSTKKFAGTIENAMGELKKSLSTCQKEVIGLEDAYKQINGALSYDKIKNILLQQQNALMNEIISTGNIPGTSNVSNASNVSNISNYPANLNLNPNPTIPKVYNNLNDLSRKSSYVKPRNFNDYTKNTNTNVLNENNDPLNDDYDSEDDYSIFDDDASETSSISGKPKTYKLILLDIHEEGNRSDEVKVQKVLRELTTLSLDDIEVRRVGKPTGKARPIVVSFDSMQYVTQILKARHTLRKTKFSMVKICPYKSKPTPNAPKSGNKPFGRGGYRGKSVTRNFRRTNSGNDGGKNVKDGPF